MSFIDSGSDQFDAFSGGNISTQGAGGYPGAAPSGGGGSNPLSSIFGGNTGAELGAGVAGGALLYDIFQGNQPTQQENTLSGAASAAGAQATSLTQQGQGLESYLTQGTLPPALQAAVDQKVAAAKASTVQQAANTTGNANPTQNSALTQDLNFQSEQGLTLQGQLETQLAQTGQGLISSGAQYAGLQNQDLIALGQAQQQQQAATGQAIAAFAGALGKLAFA
jgi:hypothetical protein